MLGDRDETLLDDTGLRVDDCCHAIGSPAPGCAPEAAQHLVDHLDQVRLVLCFREHAPELARTGERAQEQVSVLAPRGLGELLRRGPLSVVDDQSTESSCLENFDEQV